MKKLVSLFLALALLFSAALAEESADEAVEEIVEDVMLDDEDEPEEADADSGAAVPDQSVFTPSYGSPWQSAPGASSYWTLPMDISDEEAVWNMLMEPITVVDIDMNKQTVLYAQPDESSEAIGMVTGQSQSLHVLEQYDNGWSLVETYSTSFHDSKVKNFNAFVTGYIQTKKLKTVKVNQNYGIVIDKLTQRLYLYKDGHLETSLAVSTGKYNPDAKKLQPYNETRSGEYLVIYTKTGSLKDEDSGMICSYALKFNAADYIHEVPHLVNADGTNNYRRFEGNLGSRASHGCIRVQQKKNPDGYNMSVLASLIKKRTDKNCIKLIIWEDYQDRQVVIPDDDTPLYYNPKGGTMYHSVADCPSVKKKFLPLTAFTFGELDEAPYSKLTACPYCQPTPRRADLEEINRVHQESSPGEIMSVYPPK